MVTTVSAPRVRQTRQVRDDRGGRYLSAEARIAEQLRQLRIARGWSQKDIGQRLTEVGRPLHQTSVSKIEAGGQVLRVADIHAFARVLGVSPAFFLLTVPPADETPAEREQRENLLATGRAVRDAEQGLRKAGADYAMALSERAYLELAMRKNAT